MPQIIVNEEDVRRILADFDRELTLAGMEIVAKAEHEAQQQLHDLDDHLGHHRLAELWDHTDPENDGDEVSGEVFSHAEDMTFFNRTSRKGIGRVVSSQHAIEGYRLMSILEGGAGPHAIAPAMGDFLAIPKGGVDEIVTEFFAQNRGSGATLDLPGAAFTFRRDAVQHPGVQANQNIERTAEEIDGQLDAWAEQIGAEYMRQV